MGYMVVYSTMRMVLRKQIFAKISTIPETSLTTFTILKTDRSLSLKDCKMSEIKVGGKMYDIVRQKDNGSSITYFCLRDQREEQLIVKSALLNDHSKSRNPFTKTTRLILDQIIKSALLSEKSGLKEYPSVEVLFDGKCHTYPCPVLPVPAPPPQQFC